MLLWLCLGALPLVAQAGTDGGAAAGEIFGRVFDAQSLAPLEGVVVRLERLGENGGATSFRSAATDPAGTYRFRDLPPTRYRLTVERTGYHPRTVEIQLGPNRVEALGVALEMSVITLPRVEVTGPSPEPYQRTRSLAADARGARAEVVRSRQERYLATDVRELTYGEVVEAVTLGEMDIFRALQRIPGVSTRDDYTATLWTRGATWDQTRVYFDGMQLYNPTHAGWLFSAVNPDAIGSASFQPGYRSARWGEGTAAVLDLRSRAGGSGRGISGTGELSPASARMALDGSLFDGQVGWMLAGRRTYVDALTGLMENLTGESDIYIPYDFSDVVFRLDGDAGDGWGFETSGILEWDNLRGDIPGLVRGNTGRWGNRAGRFTLRFPAGRLAGRFTAAQTLFGTDVGRSEVETVGKSAIRLPALNNDISHQTLTVQVEPDEQRPEWSVGLQLVRDSVRYEGPVSILGILAVPEGDEVSVYSVGVDLEYAVLWGERRWRLGPVDFETGARVEVGDSVQNGGRVRLAPRLVARTTLRDETLASATWTRTYQYTQDVSPAAGPVGPQLHLSALWLLAEPSPFRPATRSDVATLGVERWLGADWLASASAFGRWTTGLLIPNPEPGEILTQRAPDLEARNAAAGFELSLRKLAGSWTGSAGYSFGRSNMRAVSPAADTVMNFAAPADVRHAVDVTGLVRLGGPLSVGGAFTFGSGVPFTQVVLPDTTVPPELRPRAVVRDPNAERTGNYASLDLMLDYTRQVGSWQVSGYLQLRNALDRRNAVTYLGSRQCPAPSPLASAGSPPECDGRSGGVQDKFEAGLPRLPLLGVRVVF